MGFRFRRSIGIIPGVRVNLGKKGASLSVGRKGITTNIGRKGTRTTYGVPGTGVSYTTKAKGCMLIIGIVIAMSGALASAFAICLPH